MLSNLARLFKPKSSRHIHRSYATAVKAVFRYKVGYRRNGVDVFTHDWVDNLILDSGLNLVGANKWNECWRFCLFGNPVSPTPVRRNSGAVTFTTTGTACVASASFFVAQDVGRLIKFDDVGGQEFYITVFTDATHVTLSGTASPAISAQTGVIWYVNETALDTFYASTNTYQTSGNGTSVTGNVFTYARTFLGAAVAAPVTLTEIGFNQSGSNSSLFDRDIIVGGISLITGDQPLAVGNLILTLTPGVDTTIGNSGTGFDSSGHAILCGCTSMVANVNSAGLTNGNNNPMDPSQNGALLAVNQTFTFPTFSNGNPPPIFGSPATGSGTLQGYSAGTFFRDVVTVWGTSVANGTIYGVLSPTQGWVQKFDTPFAKSNLQTLTITSRVSWQRILLN